MKKLLYTFIFTFIMSSSIGLIAQTQTNLDIGLRYIEEHAQEWGLVESDYSDVMISDMYTNKNTGLTYIYFTQAHKGIPIHNAITPVVISKEGIAKSVNNRFIQNMEGKINSSVPSVKPEGAIKSSVAHLGLTISEIPSLKRSDAKKNIYEYGKASFAENELSVKLIYIQVNDEIKLAWSLAIDETVDADYYNTFVDAQTGEVIYKHNYNKTCKFSDKNHNHASCGHKVGSKKAEATVEEVNTMVNAAVGAYNVFALPAESPIHGPQVLLSDPYFVDYSPFGWHDTNGADGAEFTILRGNNVHAFLDKDGNSEPSDGTELDGGADLNFDLVYDNVAQAPENEDAATVNLFYMNNMVHDITARLGFDSQAGNFQQSTYGEGGLGGDFVQAKASASFDQGTLNNASFSTPPDGTSGEMNMFLWTNPTGSMGINEPEELAGLIADVGVATFGVPIPGVGDEPIIGNVAVARDFSPQNNTTICSEVSNPEEIEGNIALVDRGLCDFVDKAFFAQEAGAIAVIICNVVGGGGTDGSPSIALGSDPNNPLLDDIEITAISLGKPDCDRIRASLLSDIDVSITIQETPPNGPDFLDGSFDNGIIAHEYGHGISNRLIGGPSAAGCLTTDEQAGEGISDYFSLILTVEEGDAGADSRGIGNFATAEGVDGRGIRTFPYSTDININPQTYDDIKTATLPHNLGEMWAITLWELHWAFIERYGLDISWENRESGNFQAAQLVIEGMKISPCNPSFIEARDAILQVDSLLNDAANSDILWTAFAKRGLGYLATDGGNSDDPSDGSENFDPFPQAVSTLKIQQTTVEDAKAGEMVQVTVTAQSHIAETQNDVVITSEIPDGLSYVDGSASMDATHENGLLTISVGDMEFDENIEVTYSVIVDEGTASKSFRLDDLEEEDDDGYETDAIEGSSIFFFTYPIANSGSVSYWASQPDDLEEIDFWLNIPAYQVTGEQPALRFAHRFDTEAGSDGGFVQVSTDGGITFNDVKDKWIRNGYNSDIQFTTFAIPLLEGFSGTTNEQFIQSYLDLSDYVGEEVTVRFRFGTDDNTAPASLERGWYLDDFEFLDVVYFDANSCISSSNPETVDQCSRPVRIIVEAEEALSVNDNELVGFDISVSPNPASDFVSVAMTAETNTDVKVSLTSIDGKVISTYNTTATESESSRSFDTSDLQAGMYLVQIKSQSGATTKKVVIQ